MCGGAPSEVVGWGGASSEDYVEAKESCEMWMNIVEKAWQVFVVP